MAGVSSRHFLKKGERDCYLYDSENKRTTELYKR